MGKLKDRPQRYRPHLVYALRREREGGALRDPGVIEHREDALVRRECLVLVHGYNNNDGEAAEAYLGFRDRQYALFPDVPEPLLEKRLGDVFWPGDADWAGPLDWLDALVYPLALGTAVDAARVLAETLQQMPTLERVDFIGHSLGCRVVLETIAKLLDAGGPPIGRVCLMAAAVPCEAVESGGAFYETMQSLEGAGIRIHLLHSKRDTVLRFAFPAGQAAGGEPSLRALGLVGPPATMPGRGTTVSNAEVLAAGHADYWGHRDNDAVTQAAQEAGTFLRIGENPRALAPRAVGETRDLGELRDIGNDRALGD